MADKDCTPKTDQKEKNTEQKEEENLEKSTDKTLASPKLCTRMLVDSPVFINLDSEEMEEF
jgi:hypothetical protein